MERRAGFRRRGRRNSEAIAGYRPIKSDVAVKELRDHVVRLFATSGTRLPRAKAPRCCPRQGGASETRRGDRLDALKTRWASALRGDRNITLPDADGCRMQVVARDGIEPYSGIDST